MTIPARTLKFKIESNDYEATYPKVSQFIGIEAMKIALTRDTYSGIAESTSISAIYARYLVDAIAFIGTCCPDVKKDLNVEALTELDMMSAKKLVSVYVDTILPWLLAWEEALNSKEEPETKEKANA